MDPEVASQLCALGEEKVNMWKEHATEEQKACALEMMAKGKDDPEWRNQQMATVNE